ncbi:HEAT repeat domain-containing protein [Frankia sp. Cj5]|uniref:HEAT repeat domain-containing protein n=1 Tax=Frankia sp. Cj5 TaxID=2880978 RepID=UPI001EF47F92|nr:HEAT repeat domain-containing protein [Frankia sp. Cj5]
MRASLRPVDLAAIRDLFHRQALFDHDVRIRRVAVEAIAAGWRDDPGTLPLLRERATDDHWAVRRVAAQAVRQIERR